MLFTIAMVNTIVDFNYIAIFATITLKMGVSTINGSHSHLPWSIRRVQ